MSDLFTAGPEWYRALAAPRPRLRPLAALNRLNALSAVVAARHGWIGACFSAADLLTVLYFGLGWDRVVLSKGHAAALQYACLHGLDRLSREDLLRYKDGPGAPQAHTDRVTPGILLDTGSLGQALSRAAGLARCRPEAPLAVVLGDGELQEGQVWEAFQAISHGWHEEGVHRNLALVVDRNGFQTSEPVDRIRRIPDLAGALRGLGLAVAEVDGHDPDALLAALRVPSPGPRVLLARTVKGGGSRFLLPEGGRQPWHARVPDARTYRAILAEQVGIAGLPALSAAFRAWLEAQGPARRASPRPGPASTRDGFRDALGPLLDDHPEVVVLDADLAEPCGLGAVADPGGRFVARGQFLELGISEQDMVSQAGGLALGGRRPVTCTYAAFMKRALDQVHANAGEGTPVVYAAHYAGLGYFTDGPSHQSLNDLSLFRAVPGLTLLEPPSPAHVAPLLRWAVAAQDGPVYLRLHRTGVDLDLAPDPARPLAPLARNAPSDRLLVASGPLSAELALRCLDLPDFAGWGLVVAVAYPPEPDVAAWAPLLAEAREVITLEEDRGPGVLRALVLDLAQRLDRPLRVRSLQPQARGWSFRTLGACLAHHGFTVEGVRRVRDALSPGVAPAPAGPTVSP